MVIICLKGDWRAIDVIRLKHCQVQSQIVINKSQIIINKSQIIINKSQIIINKFA